MRSSTPVDHVTLISQQSRASAAKWTIGDGFPIALPGEAYVEDVVALPGRVTGIVFQAAENQIQVLWLDSLGTPASPSQVIIAPTSSRGFGDFGASGVDSTVVIVAAWRSDEGSRRDIWTIAVGHTPKRLRDAPVELGPFLGVLADTSLLFSMRTQRLGQEMVGGVVMVPGSALSHIGSPYPTDTILHYGVEWDEESGSRPIFGYHPGFAVDVTSDGLLVVPDTAPVVFSLSLEGKPQWKSRWSTADRSVTPAAVDAWRKAYAESIVRVGSDHPERVERSLTDLAARAAASRFPSASRLIALPDGTSFIREYDLPGNDQDGERWIVLGPNGQLLAELTIPAGFRTVGISEGLLVAERSDTLGGRYEAFRIIGWSAP
ncbi:MAG: hypothetical protein WEA24_11800 [Gemmatimonadota bacterium]